MKVFGTDAHKKQSFKVIASDQLQTIKGGNSVGDGKPKVPPPTDD